MIYKFGYIFSKINVLFLLKNLAMKSGL